MKSADGPLFRPNPHHYMRHDCIVIKPQKFRIFHHIKIFMKIWFVGKWMQLEDIMLSEVSQAQEDKG
jgi:hypothetical protein